MGDPVFDAFYATQIQAVAHGASEQAAMQLAGAALLNIIGPAVLIGHSQGGVIPWLLADARPDLVKGIIGIEPSGPPFHDIFIPGGTAGPARPWGPADIPLTYSPAPTTNSTSGNPVFDTEVVDVPGQYNGTRSSCIIQKEPAKQLVNLKMPVLMETGEASFHAVYDHCTAMWLKQAGVNVTHWRLEELGIHGNGHMQFMENNSENIAIILEEWIRGVTGG